LNAGALRDVEVTSSKKYLQMPWFPPIVRMSPRFIPREPGPYFYRYVRSGERYGWWFYESKEHFDERRATDWTVTDGETSLHVTDLREHPYAEVAGRAIRTGRQVGIDVDEGTALLFLGWYNAGNPLEAFEADSLEFSTSGGEAADEDTFLLSYRPARHTQLKFWLDPSRRCAVVKAELHQDGGLRNRRVFSEFEEAAGGAWLPRRVSETQFKPEEGEVAFECVWKVFSLQPSPKSSGCAFETAPRDLPEGFVVEDHVTGREWVVGEEESEEGAGGASEAGQEAREKSEEEAERAPEAGEESHEESEASGAPEARAPAEEAGTSGAAE